MPAQFTLPPDTRAIGNANPPADVNALVDAVTAMGATFNVLNAAYAGGADPTGAGDSTAAIQAAVTAAAAAGGGTVTFPPGTYIVNNSAGTAVTITGSGVYLAGAGPGLTTIQTNYNAGGTGHLNYLVQWKNGSGPSFSSPTTTLTADLNAGLGFAGNSLTVASVAGISAGDVILIGDNYATPDGDATNRGEFAKVTVVNSGTKVLTLFSSVADSYLVSRSAGVWELAGWIYGGGAYGITFRQNPSLAGSGGNPGIHAERVQNFRVANCEFGPLDNRANELYLLYGCHYTDCYFHDLTDNSGASMFGYGIHPAPVQDMTATGCVFQRVRHAVTPDGDGGSIAWSRNHAYAGLTCEGSSTCSYDTHAAASDILFSDCVSVNPLFNSFNSRSARTRFKACSSYNSAALDAIISGSSATNNEISDCYFEGSRGTGTSQCSVQVQAGATAGPSGTTIRANTFRNVNQPAIYIGYADPSLTIADNMIINPNQAAASTARAGILTAAAVALPGARILGNRMTGGTFLWSSSGSETSCIVLGNRQMQGSGGSPAVVTGGAQNTASNNIVDNYVAEAPGSTGQLTPSAANPEDHGLLAWVCDPAVVNQGTTILIAGTLYMTGLYLHRPMTVANVKWYAAAGSGAVAGQSGIALYNSAGTRVAFTMDDAIVTKAGVATEAVSFGAVAPGFYWIAFLVNASSMPSAVHMGTAQSSFLNFGLATAALRFCVNGTALTAFPSSLTLASNTQTGFIPIWAGVS